MFVNWVQQALSNFLFVFRFFSLVLVVTNEPPLVLQSCFCMKTSIISKCNNKTGQDLTDNNNVPLYHSTKNSGEERGERMIQLRWMRSVIWEKTSQAWSRQSSVNICRTDRGVLSWSIDINLPWSRLFNLTFHSYNNIEILLFCQIWSSPELLSVLIIPEYSV